MRDEQKQIYLVGPCRLLNELMAIHIQGQAGIPCTVAGFPERPWSMDYIDGEKCLILCDCQGPCLEELAEIFGFEPGEGPKRTFLAVFNLRPDAELERPALDLGVRGFFYKDDTADILLKGIDAIFEGEFWASRRLLAEYVSLSGKGKFLMPEGRKDLTAREMEILDLLASGATNKMIAEKFCISPHTVKTHLYRIFKKIKVNNRLQAARWACGRLP
jgi:DNA-binding NarL/FixJ family response regulator